MGDCCSCGTEAKRDGSGQLSRYLKALDPSYALIDDRSIDDLLVFAKRYANQIRFYDIRDNEPTEETNPSNISWREFFSRDMAVIAASISVTDSAQIKKDYDELRVKLDANPSYATFGDLFDPILGMIAKLDGYYAVAITDNPLYADMKLAIASNLKSQAQQIVAYEKGFNYVDASHPLNLDYSAIKNKEVWGFGDNMNADVSIFTGTDTEEKIRNGALYVDDIFNNFYSFLHQLITNSEGYLQFALKHYPGHQPHMALFLAFIQLFQLVQDQMNGITKRMLDFYYCEVLHLVPKSSIPDRVHIVFELAKDVEEYDVEPGTALKAGKDASGKDQIYTTETDLVINQARVKEIKNILVETASQTLIQADGTEVIQDEIKHFYARPVANSQDGFGLPLTEAGKKWPVFGEGSLRSTSTNICEQISLSDGSQRVDHAKIGFAIASPQLKLQEGNRLLQIHLAPGDNEGLFAKAKDFQSKFIEESFFMISLTGGKGWLYVDKILSDEEFEGLFIQYKLPDGSDETLGIFNPDIKLTAAACYLDETNDTISVYLPPAEQAVIDFDATLHTGFPIQTAYPVARILINPSAEINKNDYQTFDLRQIEIRAKVGSINPPLDQQNRIIELNVIPSAKHLFTYHTDGLKKLVIQNKDGVLPPDKPFDPFTAYPFPGRSFYIGSDEVFNKPFGSRESDQMALNIFKTQDSNDLPFEKDVDWENYSVSVLKQHQWNLIRKEEGDLFHRRELTQNFLYKSVIPIDREPIDSIAEWKSNTEKDFLRVDLREQPVSIGLKDEAKPFSAAADSTNILLRSQNLAPGLEVREISLSYDSTLTIEMGIDQFFHVYPFGAAETYLSSSQVDKKNLKNSRFDELKKKRGERLLFAKNKLLPQFNYLNPYSKYYVGDNDSGDVSFKMLKGILIKDAARDFENSKSATAIRLMLSEQNDAANIHNQYDGILQEGILYIGIENLKPLQNISMLCQFAEGSAEDEDNDPPPVNWSYLCHNEWKPLKAENVVSDGTYGFQTTGIIKISMPADATSDNTIITNGLMWLSASVNANADRIPQLINIVTQAVEAQFQDANNDPSHFDNVLPAGSISKLVAPVAQIGKVQQPFASFDGKHQEIGKELYTRVSERLRHKGRAINAWDYEHLVLDRFPSIYKVKCITHTDPNCLCRNKEKNDKSKKQFQLVAPNLQFDAAGEATIVQMLNDLKTISNLKAIIITGNQNGNIPLATALANLIKSRLTVDGVVDASRVAIGAFDTSKPNGSADITLGDYIVESSAICCGPQIAPGHVLIIPISDLRYRNAVNPLQPKTGRRTLIAIQEYLKTKTSPFVHVHAKNPVYEQIIVSFKVRFYSGVDKGYYTKKLNDEMVRFLTPWAFDERADVKFDQEIYASAIINFIEERPYVDFITDFVMGVCCHECCPPNTEMQNGGVIKGNVYDDVDKQKPLSGVALKIKELNRTVVTDADGSYNITSVPPGDYTLIAYFSLFNMANQDFTIPDAPDPVTPVVIPDFIRGGEQAGYNQDEISAFFSKLCSCHDIEQILENDPNFNGDIVARPCTSRSLLVSAPRHIIIPYDEEEAISPCQKRKVSQKINNALPGMPADRIDFQVTKQFIKKPIKKKTGAKNLIQAATIVKVAKSDVSQGSEHPAEKSKASAKKRSSPSKKQK